MFWTFVSYTKARRLKIIFDYSYKKYEENETIKSTEDENVTVEKQDNRESRKLK
jgi:hypothetical protein